MASAHPCPGGKAEPRRSPGNAPGPGSPGSSGGSTGRAAPAEPLPEPEGTGNLLGAGGALGAGTGRGEERRGRCPRRCSGTERALAAGPGTARARRASPAGDSLGPGSVLRLPRPKFTAPSARHRARGFSWGDVFVISGVGWGIAVNSRQKRIDSDKITYSLK